MTSGRAIGMAAALGLALTGTAVAVGMVREGEVRDPAFDRALLVRSVHGHGSASLIRSYRPLAEALPNAKTASGGASHDSVVVGTITDVADGRGFDESGTPPTEGRPGASIVDFNAPSADWRTLEVTVTVQETLAGRNASTVSLSWPIMGSSVQGEDSAAIARALRDLGTVVILSRVMPTGPEYLGITRKVPERETGVLTVASDGGLSFPLASEGFDAAAFRGGIDNLDELRAAARAPEWTRPTR